MIRDPHSRVEEIQAPFPKTLTKQDLCTKAHILELSRARTHELQIHDVFEIAGPIFHVLQTLQIIFRMIILIDDPYVVRSVNQNEFHPPVQVVSDVNVALSRRIPEEHVVNGAK